MSTPQLGDHAEGRIRNTIRFKLRESPKDQRKGDHLEQRLDNRPANAYGRL
jgi:hypothetical protein